MKMKGKEENDMIIMTDELNSHVTVSEDGVADRSPRDRPRLSMASQIHGGE